MERLGHFDGIASSLACIPTKQHGVRGGKYPLNTPRDAISEILNFTISQKRAPLVRVPKPPTIHYQPAIEKRFDSPGHIGCDPS